VLYAEAFAYDAAGKFNDAEDSGFRYDTSGGLGVWQLLLGGV
jgi:hypothetical protein